MCGMETKLNGVFLLTYGSLMGSTSELLEVLKGILLDQAALCRGGHPDVSKSLYKHWLSATWGRHIVSEACQAKLWICFLKCLLRNQLLRAAAIKKKKQQDLSL